MTIECPKCGCELPDADFIEEDRFDYGSDRHYTVVVGWEADCPECEEPVFVPRDTY